MLCHDPRISDDRTHKIETDNPALIAAEMLRDEAKPVDWEKVKTFANWADLPADEQDIFRNLRTGSADK